MTAESDLEAWGLQQFRLGLSVRLRELEADARSGLPVHDEIATVRLLIEAADRLAARASPRNINTGSETWGNA